MHHGGVELPRGHSGRRRRGHGIRGVAVRDDDLSSADLQHEDRRAFGLRVLDPSARGHAHHRGRARHDRLRPVLHDQQRPEPGAGGWASALKADVLGRTLGCVARRAARPELHDQPRHPCLYRRRQCGHAHQRAVPEPSHGLRRGTDHDADRHLAQRHHCDGGVDHRGGQQTAGRDGLRKRAVRPVHLRHARHDAGRRADERGGRPSRAAEQRRGDACHRTCQGRLGDPARRHDDQPGGGERPRGLHRRAVRQGHARRHHVSGRVGDRDDEDRDARPAGGRAQRHRPPGAAVARRPVPPVRRGARLRPVDPPRRVRASRSADRAVDRDLQRHAAGPVRALQAHLQRRPQRDARDAVAVRHRQDDQRADAVFGSAGGHAGERVHSRRRRRRRRVPAGAAVQPRVRRGHPGHARGRVLAVHRHGHA